MQSWLSSALILIALFTGFIALVFWAWSKHRKANFEAASRLPLEEDTAVIADTQQEDTQQETRVSNDLSSKKS